MMYMSVGPATSGGSVSAIGAVTSGIFVPEIIWQALIFWVIVGLAIMCVSQVLIMRGHHALKAERQLRQKTPLFEP